MRFPFSGFFVFADPSASAFIAANGGFILDSRDLRTFIIACVGSCILRVQPICTILTAASIGVCQCVHRLIYNGSAITPAFPEGNCTFSSWCSLVGTPNNRQHAKPLPCPIRAFHAPATFLTTVNQRALVKYHFIPTFTAALPFMPRTSSFYCFNHCQLSEHISHRHCYFFHASGTPNLCRSQSSKKGSVPIPPPMFFLRSMAVIFYAFRSFTFHYSRRPVYYIIFIM